MNLSRKYKLRNIIPLDNSILEIFEFVDSVILNLKIFKMDGFDDWLFFMGSKNSTILKYDTKTNWLYVTHTGFWEVLETRHLLCFFEIQGLIRSLVEDIHKIKLLYVITHDWDWGWGIEEAYRNKRITE